MLQWIPRRFKSFSEIQKFLEGFRDPEVWSKFLDFQVFLEGGGYREILGSSFEDWLQGLSGFMPV